MILLRRLLFRENGMVSVYLSVVLAAIFLFVSIFIDYARIRLAQAEAETALKAGMRSLFSAYDRELRTYGLFGVGLSADEKRMLFQEMTKANLSSAVASPVNLTNISLISGSVELKAMASLGNKTAFQNQVLEDMKFRAPIEFIRHLTDKFGNGKKIAEAADQFVKESNDLHNLLERREDLLEEAWSQAQRMVDKLNRYSATYASILTELASLNSELAGVFRSALESALANLQRVVPQSPEEAMAIMQQIYQISMTLGKFDRRERLRTEIKTNAKRDYEGLKSDGNALAEIINDAMIEDRKIEVQAQKWKNEQKDTELGNALSIADRLEILGDGYFVKYRADIAALQSAFGAFWTMVDKNMAVSAPESLLPANANYRDLANKWHSAKAAEMAGRAQRRKEAKRKQKEKEDEAKAELDKAKQQQQKKTCGDGDRALYEKLEGKDGLYRYYALSGASADAAADAGVPDPNEDPKTFGKQSFSFLRTLFTAAENFRDTVYINEYALTYFNYRTYGMEAAATKPLPGMTDPAAHRLLAQEAEYILHGFASCDANYAAVYGELYSVRFAVRTVEALMDVKKSAATVVSPWLVILEAVVEGATKAYQDMERLLKGEEVPLFARSPHLKLSYSEYLRLFMLFGGETAKMYRMMALIQLNTEKDLTEYPVYAMGKAQTSVPLWFIPGVVKLLDMAGAVDGQVKGTSYEHETTAYYSY